MVNKPTNGRYPSAPTMPMDAPLTPSAARLRDTIERDGLDRLPEPVVLASGAESNDYIDVKRALASGPELDNAAEAVLNTIEGIDFDAVGGLTLGADHIAAAIAMRANVGWFAVRKQPKTHGAKRLIEGTRIDKRSRVLLVDDVVTKGGSIMQAFDAVRGAEATVAAAVTLVDRGDHAASQFAEHGVPYFAVVTYNDLDIKPV